MTATEACISIPVGLYLNGAFFDGIALDSSILLSTDYEAAQRSVVEQLLNGGSLGWRYDKVVNDQAGLRFSVKGKYPTLIPVSFASKTGPELIDRVHRRILEFTDETIEVLHANEARVEVDNANIDFFDFGVGVLAIKLTVTPLPMLSMGALRSLVEDLSTVLVRPLNDVIAEAVKEFSEAVHRSLMANHLSQVFWLQDDGYLPYTGKSQDLGRSDPSRLLWLHRTYILGPQIGQAVEKNVEQLLPSLYERAPSQHMLFVPGLASSAIVLYADSRDTGRTIHGVDSLLTLMDLQWAYIAAAMEIDRTLFRRLNGFRACARDARATALEQESRSVLELYDRVRLFRAGINSIIVDLGGGTRRLWDVMARVQSIPEISITIDDKLSALRDACGTLLQQASAKRQRAIALTVDLFATFSVLASVVAVTAFFFQKDLEASTVTRIVVVALAGLLVVVALVGARLAFQVRRSSPGTD